MPVRRLFHNIFIGNGLHRKWPTIRGWICANMAHMRRQSGVLGVSAMVAHARSERIVRPCIAALRERDYRRARSPSCQARMVPLAHESSLPSQNGRLGDPALPISSALAEKPFSASNRIEQPVAMLIQFFDYRAKI